MATIDEKAMNGADLKRFASLIKKTATQNSNGMMSKEDKVKLEGKQDALSPGDNVSFSGTGNSTISALDEKVNQTPTTTNTDIPMLLANGATPSNGGVQFSSDLKYNPSTSTLRLGAGTITPTSYSGNAATATNATNDGAGNNIASTYATKEEAMSQHPTIVTSLPAADGTHGGLYFVRNSSSSTPTKNVYDEYIEVNTGTDSSPLWVWEEIGSTDVTLNVTYLTTSEVQQIWESTEWT